MNISVDYYFVSQLRNHSFQVISISESSGSLSNESILSFSLVPPSVMMTEDKDSGELVFKNQWQVFGIIIMRYSKSERKTVVQRLLSLLLNHSAEITNSFR